MPHRIRTVLFDLDGTLADTALDLAWALNHVLTNNNHAALSFEKIRPVVSHGGQALIKLGFKIDTDHPRFETFRQQLLTIYQEHIADRTTVFDGMGPVLEEIERRGLNWGVVTNKPSWLTDPLMEKLELNDRAACIVSGDTLNERKPHPAPLLYACEQTGSTASQCVYVGDAERDITAGREAGMHTLVAVFGYIGENDSPENWGADELVQRPGQILDWIDRNV